MNAKTILIILSLLSIFTSCNQGMNKKAKEASEDANVETPEPTETVTDTETVTTTSEVYPQISFKNSESLINENESLLRLTIQADKIVTKTVQIKVRLIGDNQNDLFLSSSSAYIFPGSNEGFVNLNIQNDSVVETDETFQVIIDEVYNGELNVNLSNHKVIIKNDDFVVQPQNCGNYLHGETKSQLKYLKDEVQNGEECLSQIQEKTCDNGSWSNWQPSEYQFDSCVDTTPVYTPPVVSFDTIESSVTESYTQKTISINFDPVPSQDIVLKIGYSKVSANLTDSEFSIPSTIFVPKNSSSTLLQIEINDDDQIEYDEKLSIFLVSDSSYVLGTNKEHTLTIVNDDIQKSYISFETPSQEVLEGDQGKVTKVKINVLASPAPLQNLAVNFQVIGMGASDHEYKVLSDTINFLPDETSKELEVEIYGDNDWGDSERESFKIVLSSSENYMLNNVLEHEVIIINDDEKPIDADSLIAFRETLWPVLKSNSCYSCHANPGAASFLPHSDPNDYNLAHNTIVKRALVDFDTPPLSDLVTKVKGRELHNCGNEQSCQILGNEIESAIRAWLNQRGETRLDTRALYTDQAYIGNFVPPSLYQDTRYEENVILKYDFTEKQGNTVLDRKVIYDDKINLHIQFPIWDDKVGLTFDGTQAAKSEPWYGSTNKIHDKIDGADANDESFAIEMWITPKTVETDGEWVQIQSINRIEPGKKQSGSYYLFGVWQKDDKIAFYVSDSQGSTGLLIEDNSPLIKNKTRHIVFNYLDDKSVKNNSEFSNFNPGKMGFIDGSYATGGKGTNQYVKNDLKWHSYCNQSTGGCELVLGKQNDKQGFKGTIHLLALHSKALTSEQVARNFRAGLPKPTKIRFDLGTLKGPGVVNPMDHFQNVYIDMEARVLKSDGESKGYMFSKPQIVYQGASYYFKPFYLKDMRIGVNGSVKIQGQSYVTLDKTIYFSDTNSYNISTKKFLSPVATVVPLKKGIIDDRFHLEFGHLGPFIKQEIIEQVRERVRELSYDEYHNNGIRLFTELNEAYSKITGVDKNNKNVYEGYVEYKSQMATNSSLQGFLSTQQYANFKLAVLYCNELVEDNDYNPMFLGALDNALPANLANEEVQNKIIDPILTRSINLGLSSQPSLEDAKRHAVDLLNELRLSCDETQIDHCNTNQRAKNIAKGVCTSIISSAIVNIK